MTYGQLSNVKTSSMEVNLIIDDAVNNARWSMTRAELKRGELNYMEVSDHFLNQITAACTRYGVQIPEMVDNAVIGRCEQLAEQNYLRGV